MKRCRLLPMAALLLLGLGQGCLYRSQHNAPGHVDLRAPLNNPTKVEPERAKDPGERYVVLSAGAYSGAGGRFRSEGDHSAAVQQGVEASLLFGSHERSLPQAVFLEHYFRPERGLGFNLGFNFLEYAGELQTGSIYAELQGFLRARGVAGAALGWALEPRHGLHGPQLTLFWNLLYMRVNYHFGDRSRGGTELTGGVLLKWRWIWARSR